MKKLCVTLLVLFCIILPLSAQNRGSQEAGGSAVKIVDANIPSGKQWAVFIAIDKYQDPEWGLPLLYPKRDAEEIKNILEKYYYFDKNEIRELYNEKATAEAIRKLFIEDLKEKIGPNDSVFVFHAGHGINEKRTKTPAWIPYDGGKNVLRQANWLPHSQIRDMLDSLEARHVFLISDSCHSGVFFEQKRGTPEPVIYQPSAYDGVSRHAMSSGADELVDDESEFAARLKHILLYTETPYITPEKIWVEIKDMRTSRVLKTQPILGIIPGTKYEVGGNFRFYRKNPTKELPPPPPPPPPPPGKFIGTWKATIEYNNSSLTYRINFLDDRNCTVTVSNGKVEQKTDGNWSWDENAKIFTLKNVVFRDAKISYLRNIDWVCRTSFANDNNFRINARPATNARNLVLFEFFRE